MVCPIWPLLGWCIFPLHLLYSVFNHKKMLNFIQCFFPPIEIIIWFLTFISLIQCITLTDSKMLKHLCFIGINPLWSWCMILVFKFFITVVLQCSVNSCCTAKWSSHTYIHTLFFSYYLPWFFSCITAFSLLKKKKIKIFTSIFIRNICL